MNKEKIREKLVQLERNNEHLSYRDVALGLLRIMQDMLDDEPEKPEEEVLKEPLEKEQYYFINDIGSVNNATWRCAMADSYTWQNHNVYKRRDDAVVDANYLRVIRKLRHLQRALNGNWKPDWKSTDQEKFYFNTSNYIQFCYGQMFYTSFFFKSSEAAEKALAELTTEELEILRNG